MSKMWLTFSTEFLLRSESFGKDSIYAVLCKHGPTAQLDTSVRHAHVFADITTSGRHEIDEQLSGPLVRRSWESQVT